MYNNFINLTFLRKELFEVMAFIMSLLCGVSDFNKIKNKLYNY